MNEYKTLRSKLILMAKGLAMGAADVVPGVSGGTIAFISGIYQHLINAICSIQPHHALDALWLIISFWKREERIKRWNSLMTIHFHFFIPLGIGIIFSILTMAKIIPQLLEDYPFYMYSLFFGLILFSLTVPFRKMERSVSNFIVLLLFAVGMYFLLGPHLKMEGSTSLFYIFFSGSIAICAMILPGLSGAYILVLLGKYIFILEALHERNLAIIVPFVLGIAFGILTFARVLKYFLNNYYSHTMAALTGIMLGSLRKIWPMNYVGSLELDTTTISVSVSLAVGGALLILILEKLATPSNSHGSVS